MYRCSVYIIFFDVDMWIGQICYSGSSYIKVHGSLKSCSRGARWARKRERKREGASLQDWRTRGPRDVRRTDGRTKEERRFEREEKRNRSLLLSSSASFCTSFFRLFSLGVFPRRYTHVCVLRCDGTRERGVSSRSSLKTRSRSGMLLCIMRNEDRFKIFVAFIFVC